MESQKKEGQSYRLPEPALDCRGVVDTVYHEVAKPNSGTMYRAPTTGTGLKTRHYGGRAQNRPLQS